MFPGYTSWNPALANGTTGATGPTGPAGATGPADTFSTTETLTNKVWVDGKQIYRKVVNFGALPNTTTKSVAHGVVGATYFVTVTGVAYNSGTTISLPITQGWPTAAGGVGIDTDATNVNIISGGNLSSYATCFITLEYTK